MNNLKLVFFRFLSFLVSYVWFYWGLLLCFVIYIFDFALNRIILLLRPINFFTGCLVYLNFFRALLALIFNLLLFILLYYCLVTFVYLKHCEIKIFRSRILTKDLRKMLSVVVDEHDSTGNVNYSENMINRQVNASLKKSFVLKFGHVTKLFVYLPPRIQLRKIILDRLPDLANEFSFKLQQSSSAWQDYGNGTFNLRYKIMVFDN